jgi:hypothetical protein
MIPPTNHGVRVPRWSIVEGLPFATRSEEYWWLSTVLEKAPRGLVVDAATGFNAEIHVVPYILGNMGFSVLAIDGNPETVKMPLHHQVFRCCGDIAFSPPHFHDFADYWVCISTFEHMPAEIQRGTIVGAKRFLRSGGYVLVTTDENEPSDLNGFLEAAGFEIGPLVEHKGEMLEPRVSWGIARKP